MNRAERRAMVERVNLVLPVSQQCRLLAVSRSAVYRKPAEVSAEDLAIMALIDRQYRTIQSPVSGDAFLDTGAPKSEEENSSR